MAKNGSNSISSEAAKQQNDDDDVITSRPLATLCIIDLFWCLYILPSIQTIASTYYYTNGLVGTPRKTIFSDEIPTGGRKFYHHYSACKMGRGQDGRLPTKIYLPAGLGEEEGWGEGWDGGVFFLFAENIFAGRWLQRLRRWRYCLSKSANVRLQKSCIFIGLEVQAGWMAIWKNHFGPFVKKKCFLIVWWK